MWWSSPSRHPARGLRAAALLLLGGLSGCGFHPLYATDPKAPHTDFTQQMARVRVESIEDRNGQILRNALIQHLTPEGEPTKPLYTLSVTLSEAMSGVGFQKDASASAGEMTITADFALHNPNGTIALLGSTTSVVDVNYLGPTYASVAAERDAEQRALSTIADTITDRVAIFLRNGPQPVKRIFSDGETTPAQPAPPKP
jgi:LPS-assembly lipoprotein